MLVPNQLEIKLNPNGISTIFHPSLVIQPQSTEDCIAHVSSEILPPVLSPHFVDSVLVSLRRLKRSDRRASRLIRDVDPSRMELYLGTTSDLQ